MKRCGTYSGERLSNQRVDTYRDALKMLRGKTQKTNHWHLFANIVFGLDLFCFDHHISHGVDIVDIPTDR